MRHASRRHRPTWAAARDEDAAHRRRQRRERVSPGSPKGVSEGCAPPGPALKWRLKFLSPARHDDHFPILVAVEDEQVRGWGSLSEWEGRCTYSATAEASVYVHEAHRGRGLGSGLFRMLLKAGKDVGLRTVLGRIAAGNEASRKMSKKLGFQHAETWRQVGEKFGKILDVHLLQLIYE